MQGYRSFDAGKSWKEDAPIRASNPYGPPSAWANILQYPGTSKLWTTYTYNIQNVTTVPGYRGEQRNDMWGVQMLASSEDLGRTWSQPEVIPPVRKAIDRDNVFNGTTLCGWSVGKPVIAPGNRVLQQFTKRHSGTQFPAGLDYVPMEQFLLASDDLLAGVESEQGDGAGAQASTGWVTLPLGERGINATAGLLAEEGDIVLMPPPTSESQLGGKPDNTTSIAYIYRTFSGYLNVAYSLDGTVGARWTPPE